jgi:hypothetical protein
LTAGSPDPLDDDGGPGDDLWALGSFAFAGRQLAGIQALTDVPGEVFRPGETEQQFGTVGIDLTDLQ